MKGEKKKVLIPKLFESSRVRSRVELCVLSPPDRRVASKGHHQKNTELNWITLIFYSFFFSFLPDVQYFPIRVFKWSRSHFFRLLFHQFFFSFSVSIFRASLSYYILHTCFWQHFLCFVLSQKHFPGFLFLLPPSHLLFSHFFIVSSPNQQRFPKVTYFLTLILGKIFIVSSLEQQRFPGSLFLLSLSHLFFSYFFLVSFPSQQHFFQLHSPIDLFLVTFSSVSLFQSA